MKAVFVSHMGILSENGNPRWQTLRTFLYIRLFKKP